MSVADRVMQLLSNPRVIDRLGEAVELYIRLENGEIKIVEVTAK